MFFEENKLNNALDCSKCRLKLSEPKMLPCGDTICTACVKTININNKLFKCILCKEQHTMPEHGLPVNKVVLALQSMQPTLGIMQKKLNILNFGGVSWQVNRIKEYCAQLRKELQLVTKEGIQQLHEQSDNLFKQIDKFEREKINWYELNASVDKEELNNMNKELQTFHTKWTEHFNQSKPLNKNISKADKSNETTMLDDQLKLDDLVITGGLLKFSKNTEYFEKSVLGSLNEEAVKYIRKIHSNIITDEQTVLLMQTCHFSLNQKCQLLYRATRDGFRAADFHSKCDNQSNTLVLIKSTNGHVFGGYTEQDWSGYGYKRDENALIFSLLNKKKNAPFSMKCKQLYKAIFCSASLGPVFGEHEIWIRNNSNASNALNTSILGSSYLLPDYVSSHQGSNKVSFSINSGPSHLLPLCLIGPSSFQRDLEAELFLAGTFRFQTTEIEVYTKIN